MSQLTVLRIAGILDKQFEGHVNMSDLDNRPPDQRRNCFLSRALAALCIKHLALVDPAIAGGSVTDGFQDGGLDAIYFDQKSDTLLLVQSKWSDSGDKPIDSHATGTFVLGIRDLLASRFERFNEKIRAKEAEIRTVLYSERPVRIRLVTAHVASQPTPSHVAQKLEDLVQELNDPVAVAKAEFFDQAGIYGLITSESKPPKIKLQIGLNDWGSIERPFLAYYGRIHVGEIAHWWNEHGNGLFGQNLRLFYLNSDVNAALRATLETAPEAFWYFNNGITIICDSIVKNLAGSPGTKVGIFTCDGVSIVNGAQTVGTIGSAWSVPSRSTAQEPQSTQSWVQVRIISLERCPPDFARRITRAANLQNAVGNREFAAMDPRQHRLATEFALDRRKYVYKSGEPEPRGAEGCSIVEATQALGCAISVALAVDVKREIGALWADTDAPPYTEIFPDSLTSTRVWRCVQVMRAVDDELQRLRSSDLPRADMVGIHMHRVILHLVFQDPAVRPLNHDGTPDEEVVKAAKAAVAPIFARVATYLEGNHPGEYLASLCKNRSKCEELADNFWGLAKSPTQGDLFRNETRET